LDFDPAWKGWHLTLLTLPGWLVSDRVGFRPFLAGFEFDPADPAWQACVWQGWVLTLPGE